MTGPVGRWFLQLSYAAIAIYLLLCLAFDIARYAWPGWRMPYLEDRHGINGTGVNICFLIGVIWAFVDLARQRLKQRG